MEFRDWLLKEMPLRKTALVGTGWKDTKNKHWWDAPSLKLLQSEKGMKKIQLAWKDTEHDYDVYFLKSKGMRDTLEKGEVNPDYVINELGIKDFQHDKNAITIIFTNNIGAERMPMTAWTMAHRFGHALQSSERYNYGKISGNFKLFADRVTQDFKELLKTVYNFEVKTQFTYDRNDSGSIARSQKVTRELMQGLGTMKSARDNKLFRPGEFMHELVAQYLITGKIRFNKEAPRMLDRKVAWGNVSHNVYSKMNQDLEKTEVGHQIESMADNYNWIIADLLSSAVGRIYVM